MKARVSSSGTANPKGAPLNPRINSQSTSRTTAKNSGQVHIQNKASFGGMGGVLEESKLSI